MRLTAPRTVCAITATLLFLSPLHAARPLAIDDCPPTEKGRVSVESGLSVINDTLSSGDMGETTSIKYGLLSGVDIGIDLPYLFLKQQDDSYISGLGDATLKSKVSVVDHLDSWAGFSFTAGVKLSNGDTAKGLGSGSNDYAINAISSKALGETLVHANLGYLVTGDRALQNSWAYGIAIDYPSIKDLHLVAEVTGGTNPDANTGVDPLSTQAGFYKEIGGIVLDAGVNFGLSDASPDNIYNFGITLGF